VFRGRREGSRGTRRVRVRTDGEWACQLGVTLADVLNAEEIEDPAEVLAEFARTELWKRHLAEPDASLSAGSEWRGRFGGARGRWRRMPFRGSAT
jgi:hypothetical protein